MGRVASILTGLLLLCGCSSGTAWEDKNVHTAIPAELHDVLRNPDKVTFCTVMNPLDSPRAAEEIKKLPAIEYLGVLDSKEVTAEEGRALIDAFVGAVRAGQSERFAKCFDPHHVVRVEKAGRVVDLVVCFKCSNFEVWPKSGLRKVEFDDASEEYRSLYEEWSGVVAKYGLKDISKRRP